MSNSGVFGPTPEGVDLSETQNVAVSSAVISLMVIATIFVLLRVAARAMQKGVTMALAVDDYCIAVGLLFAHGTAVCSLVSLSYGGGKHLWAINATQFTVIWKILFAYVIIYALAVSFTKLSIVLFYRRLFGMNWGLWFCAFLVVAYCITVIVTILVSCQPLRYFWTQYTTPGATGHCINVPLFFFANGIWAMLVDVCILIVPIPIILKLDMPKSQKIAVMLIMLLGSFVCIASIIRIITIHVVITSDDLTWAMGQLFIWSCCEPYIGIVCACLPTLAPFFRRWWATLVTKSGGTSKKRSYGGTNPSEHMSGTNTGGLVKSKDRDTNISDTQHSRSGSKREWILLPENVKVRDDDQIELTTNVTESRDMKRAERDEELGIGSIQDIHVQKDVTWRSSHPAT
ncbi:hypothetical protein IFR04_007695 [Cadophora malorum]|uniref:Rhodopsin domain-containing protein n=1 Tax=Cadophora malorum TaxID=108018 RepID=A0A8H7TCS2_9HELO|nr:hypothetical protein IFR04_007695 [Cadophora malorum]